MSNQWPLAICLVILSIGIECAILCCKSVARKVPVNYILLLIFTLCQAFYFSVITTMYTASSVLAAAGMTSFMTVAITFYACTTKTDFTACGGLFFCIFIGVFLLSFVSIFMSFVAWWHPFMCALMVIIYGLYLIYDTQLIAGGG